MCYTLTMDIGIEYQVAGNKALRAMKKDRLRDLVAWGYITQAQANEQYRQYLRLFRQVNRV